MSLETKSNPIPTIDGILLVDKDAGWTSHDACALIRNKFRIKRVGHAGTLDPFATGLLIVLLGKATKLSDSFMAFDKQYSGTIRLGITSDSYDSQGTVVSEKPWEHITEQLIHEKVNQFRGDLEQEPPMMSAIRQQGVRLYKLARQGKTVERPKRKVTVFKFDIKQIRLPFIDIEVHVSKGTYVRSLAHDLGESLGCGAILESLRRTKIGDYCVEHAVPVPDLKTMSAAQLQTLLIEAKG